MSDILKLQTNVPERIALQYATGRPMASKFGGDQIMYSLTDGRLWFAPPFVAAKIADAGIRPSEWFEVCKRELVNGNRRSVEYSIDLLEAGVSYVGSPAAPPAPPAPVAVPAPRPVAVERAAVAVMEQPGSLAKVTGLQAAGDSALTTTGMEAIDAVLAVELYARSKGMVDFCFGPENIQKVWLTRYINALKGGRA